MAAPVYFRDRRTGTVYTTRERTLPTEGKVPLKAAYKSDTVWIDRAHLDRVKDPHEYTVGRLLAFTVVMLIAVGLWILASVHVATKLHIGMVDALSLQFGWSLIIWSLLVKVTVHYD